MIDQPTKPERCTFCIIKLDSDNTWSVAIGDKDDEDNDNVEVDHEEFNNLFGNEAECVFGPWDEKYLKQELKSKALKTYEEIRDYLISIGMKEEDRVREE